MNPPTDVKEKISQTLRQIDEELGRVETVSLPPQCSNCGNDLELKWEHCPYCGKTQNIVIDPGKPGSAPEAEQRENVITSLIRGNFQIIQDALGRLLEKSRRTIIKHPWAWKKTVPVIVVLIFLTAFGWSLLPTLPLSLEIFPTATFTVSPTLTPMMTITPSSTPSPQRSTATSTRLAPSPTATRNVPDTVVDFLNDAVVRQFDNFNTSRGWELYAGKISNGRLELPGKNWNGLMRKGKISENEAIIIDFRYDTGSVFELHFDYEDWQSDQYRRFGIYVWRVNSPDSNIWLGKNSLGFNSLQGNLQIKPNSWYTLLMAAGTDGEFLSVVWETNSSEKSYRYQKWSDETWSNYKWNFRIGADAGRVEFSNFYKIDFSNIR